MNTQNDININNGLNELISINYFDVPLDAASLFTVTSFYVFLIYIYTMYKGTIDRKVLVWCVPLSIAAFVPKILNLEMLHPIFEVYDFGAIENRWIGLFIIVSFLSSVVLCFQKKPNAHKLFISIATLCVSLGIFVTHITSIQYNIRTNAYLSSEYVKNIATEKDFNKFVEYCKKMDIECLVRDKPIDYHFIEDSNEHVANEFRKLIDNTESNNINLINSIYINSSGGNKNVVGKGTVSVDFHESQAIAYTKVDGLYRLVYSDRMTKEVYQLNAWNFFIVIYSITMFWILAIWLFSRKHPVK